MDAPLLQMNDYEPLSCVCVCVLFNVAAAHLLWVDPIYYEWWNDFLMYSIRHSQHKIKEIPIVLKTKANTYNNVNGFSFECFVS